MTGTAGTAAQGGLPLITDAFRDPVHAQVLLRGIQESASALGETRLMEVCGSHTVAIFRSGLRRLLPSNIQLISGPGCPVCVTAQPDIDAAVAIAHTPGAILTTFGDMMRVPGSGSSLQQARSEGADVRILYSPLDGLELALNNPDRRVVFFGAGFETTAPTVAATLLQAAQHREGPVDNFSVYSVHKTIPPAMNALLSTPGHTLDGLICPGHVSVIIGPQAYDFIARDFKRPAVISGFEPVDILMAVHLILKQLSEGKAEVANAYERTVGGEGNPRAREILDQVFEAEDAEWRGIGVIPGSGLAIRDGLARHDAKKLFSRAIASHREHNGRQRSGSRGAEPAGSDAILAAGSQACECGEVLLGKKIPPECRLFDKGCTPERPQGACMVSSEGSCSAYHRYGRR